MRLLICTQTVDKDDSHLGFFVRWLLENGSRIFAFQFKGMWYDIGDLKSLEEADRVFQSKK